MSRKSPARAIDQVRRIEGMCDFLECQPIKDAVEQSIPVTMPADAGSLGLDIPLWVGLGMVGLWAALDAFAERAGLQSKCSTCGMKCIVTAYTSKFKGTDGQSFAELEDLRHLYAHNYAGAADDEFFKRPRRRHVLKRGVCVQLSCGAIFDGWRLSLADGIPRPDLTRWSPHTVYQPRLSPPIALNLSHLRMYSRTVLSVLERFP